MKVNSRLMGFYKQTIVERLRQLSENTDLEEQFCQAFSTTELSLAQADRMIENVVGTFNLPFGLGLNFFINDRDYIVPMAIEEPSVIAAVSNGAKIVRAVGGFKTESDLPLMIGQIQIIDCDNLLFAKEQVLARKQKIIDYANTIEPKMRQRGGGVKDIEVRIIGDLAAYPYCQMLIVHLIIDTCDAMGANLIDTIAEGTAPILEELTGGKTHLKILSNLADKRLARAKTIIPAKELSTTNYSGEEVIDGIVSAYHFAYLDPYRATTHNKGIMNGIDAVVIATGNDWRSVESSAHAYAAKTGKYLPLSKWERDKEGNLVGSIELPMAVGMVGGATQIHPMAKMALALLDVQSARELAEVMAAVGLAQNLTALKALATEGIQRGHMALHARSVAMAAGATGPIVDIIARQLVIEKKIKVERAKELLEANTMMAR